MTITPIGFVIIPLSLIIFLVWPRLLVPWAIIVSVFEAASVINVGGGESGIGIQPFFFVVVLITLRFLPPYLVTRAQVRQFLHLLEQLFVTTPQKAASPEPAKSAPPSHAALAAAR